MIGSSARWPRPRRTGRTRPPPADQWDWHEVVPNEHLSPARTRASESGWTWGHTWTVVRLSVLPLLVTALALTTALLTLVGLVARPLPWSPAPVFGGSSDRQAAPAPTRPSPVARSVARRAEPTLPTTLPTLPTLPISTTSSVPRAAGSVAAASGTPIASSPSASSGAAGRYLPLPSPPVSVPAPVSISVSIPAHSLCPR